MKRCFVLLLVMLFTMICINAYADGYEDLMGTLGSLINDTKEDPSANTGTTDNTTGTLIQFRGIEWYSDYETVHNFLESECIDSYFCSFSMENTTIDSIYSIEWGYSLSDDRVDEAGIGVGYMDMPVAGYVADVYAYYMYPITDGKVDRSTEKAEFYVAYYSFEDMENLTAVYDDLTAKLTALYGEGIPKTDKYYDSIYWQDAEGNMVWLLIEDDASAVRLGYAAGDHITRLDTLREQIRNETIAAEDESRQENSGNTSGL